ncbi:hypothetical protein Nepgr_032568 [Nepenthes gracilis]|uniref:Secreted protein n=1 Tax=Nepenthes gracilis TaxID=150966 RepID=A0AAD3TIV3_NEPGR|nr:hypothetical protein Nepgr_032568 [Nepenthes gracilis]
MALLLLLKRIGTICHAAWVLKLCPTWDSLADGISSAASSTINSEARPLPPPLPPLTLLRSFGCAYPMTVFQTSNSACQDIIGHKLGLKKATPIGNRT